MIETLEAARRLSVAFGIDVLIAETGKRYQLKNERGRGCPGTLSRRRNADLQSPERPNGGRLASRRIPRRKRIFVGCDGKSERGFAVQL